MVNAPPHYSTHAGASISRLNGLSVPILRPSASLEVAIADRPELEKYVL